MSITCCAPALVELAGIRDLHRVHEPKIEAILGNFLHLELVRFNFSGGPLPQTDGF